MAGDYFVIQSEHDEMMPSHFARRLLEARYARRVSPELMHSRTFVVPGGHCAFFADVPELAQKYRKYLVQCGFIDG